MALTALRLGPLFALFASVGILLASSGMQGTLLSIRGNLENFGTTSIGLLGSAYFVGFIAGCFLAPKTIRRIGHIRCFATLAAIGGVTGLVHAMVVDPWAWIGLRAISGYTMAGLVMIVESWINARTTRETRGQIFSIYRVVDMTCVTGGQFILALADPMGFALFSICSILYTIALVPVSLTNTKAPPPEAERSFAIMKAMVISPLGALAVMSTGLVNASFRNIAPIVAQDVGLSLEQLASFMAVFIAGGALVQWPIGWLSDKIDRRHMLLVLGAAAMACSLWLQVAVGGDTTTLMIAAFVFGGASQPIYAVAVAHTNDFAKADEFVQVSASLLLIFAIGAIIGPFVSALLVDWMGPSGLFQVTFWSHALLIGFSVYRMTVRATVPKGFRRRVVGLMRTSPAIFNLDPRSDDKLDEGKQLDPDQDIILDQPSDQQGPEKRDPD